MRNTPKTIPTGRQKMGIAATIFALAVFGYGASNSFAGDTAYKYDSLGRVIEVLYPDNTLITYSYDQAGNRTQATATLNASSSSSSSGTNVAPVCVTQNSTITGVPANATVTITITASQIISLCSDANGDTLSVTVPTALPVTFNLAPASSVTTNYTVSDGRTPPLTDSDVIVFTRP